MTRRRRRRLGPVQQQRAASALILLGSLVTGLGAWLRESAGAGESQSWGYLLGTFGLFLVFGGAVWCARVAGILVVFEARRVRRRAILSLLAGIFTVLLGCIAASAITTDKRDAILQAVAEAGIAGGIGFGLAGLFSLMWAFGLDYAGEKIDHLSKDEW